MAHFINKKTGQRAQRIKDNYELNQLCTMQLLDTGEILHWELIYDWEPIEELSLYQKENQLLEHHLNN